MREKVGELLVSERSLRRYVGQVKRTVASRQRRYYEPVLDMVPGVQCQVDPGELRDVMISSIMVLERMPDPHNNHLFLEQAIPNNIAPCTKAN